MLIQFTSDGSVQGAGFSGDWSCGGQIIVDPIPIGPAFIASPAHVAGSIANGGDTVHYTMHGTAGVTYTIEASASGASPISDTYLTIYASNHATCRC